MASNLKTLIGKLNPTCKDAAEKAINHCISRGQYKIDLEHLLLSLLENPRSDFALLCRHYKINSADLEQDLLNEIAELKTGNMRTPVFSTHVSALFEQAWLLASLDSHASRIRSAHVILALLTQPDLMQLVLRGSRQFARFPADEMRNKLAELTANLPEAVESFDAPPISEMHQASRTVASRHNLALDHFTMNLTQLAREGKIDPVIGRDAEIRQMIDILMRRRQNNPILTGEAGVGKTAVVEALAQYLINEDIPPPLRGVELRVLDLGLLQAGANIKGEFEDRLRKVIEEVRQAGNPIILFIDEAHTMIGAGAGAGQNDAANLLKPALARGELRMIAATTWREYKKYFEKDAALARRFQIVKIEEPTEELAGAMLRGLAWQMEKHFNVRVMDDAITDAVRLSSRYISGRHLPDKAISVLDTACARVAIAQSAVPAVIEDLRRTESVLSNEILALERESMAGGKHDGRLADLHVRRNEIHTQLEVQEKRWEKEKLLVKNVQELRHSLEEGTAAPWEGRPSTIRAPDKIHRHGDALLTGRLKAVDPASVPALTALQDELRALQGESPLIPACVDARVVAEIVSAWTGIPLGKMVKDEVKAVMNLRSLLEARVIGQPHAIEQIAQRVRTARANLEDPDKPKGVFLFVGPSGVGKTETALALAEAMYGGERNLLTINMSEYQEAHSVSGLKGSPPGYVGYGEGGVLTEAVRRKPYCVVLLDEVEKAHPDVLELFFQVFDKGVMDDAEGRQVDFRNAVIILTSNVASQAIMQACQDKGCSELPAPDALGESIRPQLCKAFKPAFLGRMKVIPFYPLPYPTLAEVVRLKLDRISKRVAANHKAKFSYSDDVVDAVLARCTEPDSGARNVDHILNGTMLPEIAETVLARMAEGKTIRSVKIGVGKDSQLSYKIN